MKLLRYLKEVFLSSLPLLAIIIIVCVFFADMTNSELLKLFVGYVCVIIGQAFFLVGLDKSILPIGKLIGNSLTKIKKIVFIILFGFLFGLLATVAEPALSVLAGQVSSINPNINNLIFIWLLGFGIGIAVAFALFRIIKNINIKLCFLIFYSIIFIMVFFVPNQFISLAFDASGATTGDVSVPFILALGFGVSHTISKSKTNDESFGIIGLASIGPILVIFVYGLILGNSKELLPYTAGAEQTLGSIILSNLSGVALALLPIVIVFLIFQLFLIKLHKKQLTNILLASLVVYVGLLIFLIGIDFGFARAGKVIGETFMDVARPEWFKWFLLPVGFFLGFSITLSEPAVVVLGEQVEELTNGHISKMIIRMTLAIGIGVAALLSILKILIDINILWFLTPLYIIALVLMIFTPKLFVGLAFDSGGVTGGAITSAFLTPLTLGISQMLGQDILTSGFGIIAFISVTPLLAVQILGIMYNIKTKNLQSDVSIETLDELHELIDDDIDNSLISGGE